MCGTIKNGIKDLFFFSKEYGIITVTAIGAQKPKSKLRGFINRFCFIEIDIVHGKNWLSAYSHVVI